MSKRRGGDWSAYAVPHLRAAYVADLTRLRGEHARMIADAEHRAVGRADPHLDQLVETIRRVHAESADEITALGRAGLYWATASMVDLFAHAAISLPTWTPSLAAPEPDGLMLWARPGGTLPWVDAHEQRRTVDWDGVWWTSDTERGMRLYLLSRLVGHRDGLSDLRRKVPLMPVAELWLPRPDLSADDAAQEGLPALSPEAGAALAMVGAVWLLMGQPRVAERSVVTTSPPRVGGERGDRPRVTLVDARGAQHDPHTAKGQAGDEIERHHRWWVSGHWRQQACGPGRSQRRPTWIDPHVKGPDGAPIMPRVHVVRGDKPRP